MDVVFYVCQAHRYVTNPQMVGEGKTRELPMFLYFDSFLMEALFEHLLLLQCL